MFDGFFSPTLDGGFWVHGGGFESRKWLHGAYNVAKLAETVQPHI